MEAHRFARMSPRRDSSAARRSAAGWAGGPSSIPLPESNHVLLHSREASRRRSEAKDATEITKL